MTVYEKQDRKLEAAYEQPSALITPPPSGDIQPKDLQCSPVISTLLLPPSATIADVKNEITESCRGSKKLKLPPPPMRSRRIIQMQPVLPKPTSTKAVPNYDDNFAALSGSSNTTTKSRRGNTSTAATRKTARKVAHSAIERRRRSKMNDEFESLKTIVPACRAASENHGEANLHKLGILQATVEYLKYLEECINQLQARVDSLESCSGLVSESRFELAQHIERKYDCDEDFDYNDEDLDDDEEMDEESDPKEQVQFESDDMEEAGKEVSRALLLLRRDSSSRNIPLQMENARVGLRVCDLLG
ncbi:hypothetical protein V1512DRAFT_260850 [Lipomyces arxii]|uniref:uncharacterized protein n=1 Tax=Lipomyces arxii TaxID=56418 RepID=UPI0034CD1BA8